MFERRQRSTQALHFTQLQRELKTHESLPPILGLAAQLMACQAQTKPRQRADQIEPSDEMDLSRDLEDDFDD